MYRQTEGRCALVEFGVIREVILGLEKLFLPFSVSSPSNAKGVFSTLCYLHSFRTINAHFIIMRGNSYVRFELIR